jgi:CheY-like chemotaxis protein
VDASAVKSLLLVEDNPGDVRLTLEAFREANRSVKLHVVSDGAEALSFLKRRGGHVCAPRPDLILLDLNMPKMDGHGLLGLIKGDEALRSIPTVVLTMSSASEDVAKSYELKANCFLTKPVEFELFEIMVRSINEFWLTRASLPRQAYDRFGSP